jgi:hypothetical protein
MVRRRKVVEGAKRGRGYRGGGHVSSTVDPRAKVVEMVVEGNKKGMLSGAEVIGERRMLDIRLDVRVIVPGEVEGVAVV